MNPAIFLDRDGTVNIERHHLVNIAKLRLISGVGDALAEITRLGYRLIIITNQSVIGRGLSTHQNLERIHTTLKDRLKRYGAIIHDIYYCPHHPSEALPEYRMYCLCRKPGVALIEKAIQDHDIDVSKSFFVGDRATDILAGKTAGLKTVLVGMREKGGTLKIEPDYRINRVSEFLEFL